MFDGYLQIEGINGSSTDKDHAGWIPVQSITHGVAHASSGSRSSSGGATSGRAQLGDFSFTCDLDESFPLLNKACVTGEHIASAELSLCHSGGGQRTEYLNYKFVGVNITAVSMAGSGGDAEPVVNVTFGFNTIEWTYTTQKQSDGSPGAKVITGFDREAQAKK